MHPRKSEFFGKAHGRRDIECVVGPACVEGDRFRIFFGESRNQSGIQSAGECYAHVFSFDVVPDDVDDRFFQSDISERHVSRMKEWDYITATDG